MNDWTLKQELYYWYAEARAQLTGNWKWRKIASGLSKLKAHIQTEREKMTRNLWLTIMYRDTFQCQLCGVRKYEGMEVDHIIPLAKWGMTKESNLQVLCRSCNRKKGVKLI